MNPTALTLSALAGATCVYLDAELDYPNERVYLQQRVNDDIYAMVRASWWTP